MIKIPNNCLASKHTTNRKIYA